MEFATRYTRKRDPREKGSGKKYTEKQGYIPAKARIENLMEAGRRLKEYRNEQYDFPDGTEIDEKFSDPTRSPNFDLADASALKMTAEANMKASAAREEERKADEAKKAAEEAAKPITTS